MIHKPKISVVILAAGEGTRMKSNTPKVLFPICGRPMINYILDAASEVEPEKIVVVIGHKGEQVSNRIMAGWARDNAMGDRVEFAWQSHRRGTGHAVACAQDCIPDDCDYVMILCGDTPLVTGKMLGEFVQCHVSNQAEVSLITALVDDPGDYGRIRRDDAGNVLGITEANDLLPEDKHLREINAGIYIVNNNLLGSLLSGLTDQNAKQEFYLTDIVEKGAKDGCTISSLMLHDVSIVQGVNDRYALAVAESRLREDILRNLCLSGVTIRDPKNTYVDFGVEIGTDTVIEPGTVLRGATNIGQGCTIGPHTEIIDSLVGDNSKVWYSVIEQSEIKQNVQIGPYSHIRPDTVIEANVLVGNFAEIKNSKIGTGSKVSHHSYLGDSFVGPRVNIGAGTVIVNYDGLRKHRTVIGENAFIGCNANLVAPVRIGKRAYVAAGSTIIGDVPDEALGIARERQTNKEGWVAKRKQKSD